MLSSGEYDLSLLRSMRRIGFAIAIVLVAFGLLYADEPPRVFVNDRGVRESKRGPGAPKHIVGLTGIDHQIDLNTGKIVYGLKYTACKDANDASLAIPGEGYIGMPAPSMCNWYAGGFFDLIINGRSIGKTMARPLFARGVSNRAYVDFIFDTPEALVRIRFVAEADGDCLFAQALLEPKADIKSLRLVTRCYPSAFISTAERHTLTAMRDVKQGENASLDTANEWWTLYYDAVYDQGYRSPTLVGAGPCAMLWLPGEMQKAGITVGSYSTDTSFDCKPELRDLRFIFLDHTGTKNADAMASIRARASDILASLTMFSFNDPDIVGWDLDMKRDEVKTLLAAVPEEAGAMAKYKGWSRMLSAQLGSVLAAGAGAIAAEQELVLTIAEWEKGLPVLKLKALLNGI